MVVYETFSPEGVATIGTMFPTRSPPPFQTPHLPRQGSESLQHSSSLNKPDHYHNDGDDQQDMNDATHRVATHQPKQPQDQENHTYGPKHAYPSFRVI
jgi:hypothetical protein